MIATALLALFAIRPAIPSDDARPFTLAVVPDTQQEVLKPEDGRLRGRFQWLVDHREDLNLKMVFQCGDLNNWDTPDHDQYERSSAALDVLDRAGVPYALAIGNHDSAATKPGGSAAPGNVHDNQRLTTTFNRYFSATRHKGMQGFYEPGKVDNAYQTFRAGGLEWLAINLELWPRTGAVDWARGVAYAHPHHNVIVVTHSHLTAKSEIEPRNGGYGDNSPQYVFDRFLKKCPNVRLVFSGHTGTHGYRKDEGEKGNAVYQFLQAYHSNEDNPMRLLTIDPKAGTIVSRVFAPSTGRDRDDGSTFTVSDVRWVPAPR